MRQFDKALLLAELFDVDTSRYATLILRDIKENGTYATLMENIEVAKNYESEYTTNFLKQIEEIQFSKISSVKEALLLKANLDYFTKISSPRYYLNPFLFTPFEIKCQEQTIGDLTLVCQNKEMTINQLIDDESTKSKDKVLALGDAIKKWKEETQRELMIPTKEMLIKSRQGVIGKKYAGITIAECLLLLGLAISFIYFIFSPLPRIITLKTTISFNALGIAFITLVALTAIFLGQLIIHYFYASKKQRARENAYDYVVLSGGEVVRKIDKAAYLLHHYLLETLEKQEHANISLMTFSWFISFRKCVFFLRKAQKETDLDMKVSERMKAVKITLMSLVIIVHIVTIVLAFFDGGGFL